MAIEFRCDATGEKVAPEDVVELGYVIKRHYSPEAGEHARQYLAEIDALHESLAALFKDQLHELRLKYLDGLRRLPDVPDDYGVEPEAVEGDEGTG